MLIVGREIGQAVIIGDNIKVTALQLGSKLKLAIDAPEHIQISRVIPNQDTRDKLKKRARLIGDTLLIGEMIKVTILQTDSGLVRFAIDAPKEISVYREELLYERRLTENQTVI
ncbi:carbon storage regulator [Neobacillus sp. LXY-1]|uniref:carbon storage regulator n=1 Tax=Neobacillus sp. LXY-1 TaxID=3379133 RepID=UPI003EDED55A